LDERAVKADGGTDRKIGLIRKGTQTMLAQLNRAHAKCFASAALVFSCVALLPTAARPANLFLLSAFPQNCNVRFLPLMAHV
jgi:hypothetical protein